MNRLSQDQGDVIENEFRSSIESQGYFARRGNECVERWCLEKERRKIG